MTTRTTLRVRVWVEDIWDTIALAVSPDWTIARLKKAALAEADGSRGSLAQYEVKFRGALVLNENATLGELNVPDNAAFSVLSSRRRPVR